MALGMLRRQLPSTSELSRASPSADPMFEVLDPDRTPKPVDGRGDLQDPVGHGVAHVLVVFAQEDSPGSGEALWPLVGGFDAAEASGEPLAGLVREPAQVKFRPPIHAWCR